jgi:hypothetical protein
MSCVRKQFKRKTQAIQAKTIGEWEMSFCSRALAVL